MQLDSRLIIMCDVEYILRKRLTYVYFFRDSENCLYFLPVFLPLPGVIPFALSSSETALSEAKYNNQVVDIIIREAKYKLCASRNSNNKIAQEVLTRILCTLQSLDVYPEKHLQMPSTPSHLPRPLHSLTYSVVPSL